jgi:enoyl-CoA hydratase/carnithine racemase
LVTGKSIDAEQALKWGLINRIVAPAELLSVAQEVAGNIASNAPLAVQAAKEMAIRARDTDRALGLRAEAAMNRLLRATEDAQEGRAAFAEQREPDYKGR